MAELTTVRLLGNVDLSSDYVNTFTFGSESGQSTFFKNKTKHLYENLTYQRREQTIKVKDHIDNLYDSNYLMFQNAEINNKWWYAFITDMKYLNDNTTEVTFEIDVMQTWKWEIEYKESFIEREHVADDTIGKHTLNENVDIGETFIKNSTDITQLEDLTYIFVATEFLDLGSSPPPSGDIYSGVYSGLWFFGSDDINQLNTWIEDYNDAGKINSIVTIFSIPKNLVNFLNSGLVSTGDSGVVDTETKDISYTNLDGYVPRNNKLYTFPYYYSEVTNNSGQSNIYRYEYFSVDFIGFRLTCNIAPNPTVYLEPMNYKNEALNGEEFLTISDYPLAPWVGGAYETWLAQNQVSNAVKVGGSLLSLGGGIATQNPLAIGGGVLGVASSIGEFKEKSIKPDIANGTPSGGGNVARGKQTFTILEKCLRYENAKVIDDYFTKFGYKVNRVGSINFETRPNWNYIKTRDCNIYGNIPNAHLEKIRNNFNQGITFWHSDNIGNYSLSN